MRYAQKFQLFRESLIAFCKTRISENWKQMFDMWLSCEADMVFGYGYQDKFKEHFGEDIPEALNLDLWLAGKNLLYAISSFTSITKNNSNLDQVIEFVEIFLSEQLDDFDNNYDTSEWRNSIQRTSFMRLTNNKSKYLCEKEVLWIIKKYIDLQMNQGKTFADMPIGSKYLPYAESIKQSLTIKYKNIKFSILHKTENLIMIRCSW